ncbi:MAG: GLPGLI family protein [Saprospiraceae bacterium]|nr:GLPGLI family protein [Saprospiraceae bacterium]
MKHTLLSLLALFLVFSAGAQVPSGVVVYEQKTNLHLRMKDMNEEMKAMVPEFQTVQKELLFSGNQTLYRTLKAEDLNLEQESDGNKVQIRMTMPEEFLFRDYDAGTKTEQRDFLGRKFLIRDAIAPLAWKVTGQQQLINGYPCMKAVMSDTTKNQEIEAWFTPAIAVKGGPEGFSQLPGLVIQVSVNGGEVVYTATSIELKPLEAGQLSEPTEGKAVTQTEFDAIVAEKMKEMGGGKGGFIRIARENE